MLEEEQTTSSGVMRHVELCQKIYLRLQQQGKLEDTLSRFEERKNTEEQGSDS